jgi:hypothetical protein
MRNNISTKKGEKVMKRIILNGSFVIVLGLFLVLTGCASHYYKVTDQSGTVYYTQELDNLKSGAVKLRDASSGFWVTIHTSEVKEISSQEYQAGLTAPTSKPVPMAAPAPTPTEAPRSAPSGT